MQTNIDNLPGEQVKQLAGLVQRIVATVDLDKIICYGYRTQITQDWSCFQGEGRDRLRINHPTFDLLVIIHDNEKRLDHIIIQIVEQQVQPPLSITCIVHKRTVVNEAIAVGSRFFTGLYHRGIMLYDGTAVPLTLPPPPPDVATTIARIKEHWDKEYTLAVQFLHGATHALSNGGPVLAIFLLHQAVEHTLIATIRMYTGYRTNTHNLSRLLALTENFSWHLTIIFPRLTKEETDLFNLLQRGYSDSRYKEGYSVTAERAGALTERVEDLQVTAETLYRDKLQSLAVVNGISFPLVKENIKP